MFIFVLGVVILDADSALSIQTLDSIFIFVKLFVSNSIQVVFGSVRIYRP